MENQRPSPNRSRCSAPQMSRHTRGAAKSCSGSAAPRSEPVVALMWMAAGQVLVVQRCQASIWSCAASSEWCVP